MHSFGDTIERRLLAESGRSEAKKNPAQAMWARCQDIDRVATMMCYLQLSLWSIPVMVIVGNTLAMEAREVFYTPAHRLRF